MKIKQQIHSIMALLLLIGVLATSCGDDDSTGPVESHVPILTTTNVATITRSSAQSGGTITSDNGYAITARGVCWSTNAQPTIAHSSTADGSGTGTFTSSITGLAYNTTYYVRAYATNSRGTGYGDTMSFTTLDSAYTVMDVGGNEYSAISIGTQVWMTENLKVTQYRNGEHIPYVTDNADWMALSDGAICYYSNDPANLLDAVGPYGCLYNWYAVNDNRGLAPAGWHIPTEADWQTLVDYLGGNAVAGGKMKEAGTGHWQSPNTGATNESGFTALPAGLRIHENGSFQQMGLSTGFWSSADPEFGSYTMGAFMMFDEAGFINYDDNIVRGLSVRCVRD